MKTSPAVAAAAAPAGARDVAAAATGTLADSETVSVATGRETDSVASSSVATGSVATGSLATDIVATGSVRKETADKLQCGSGLMATCSWARS